MASSRWAFDFWWLAPDIELFEGRSPSEYLEDGGDPGRVLAAADRWVEAHAQSV